MVTEPAINDVRKFLNSRINLFGAANSHDALAEPRRKSPIHEKEGWPLFKGADSSEAWQFRLTNQKICTSIRLTNPEICTNGLAAACCLLPRTDI